MTLIPRWLKSLTFGTCLLSAALAWALPTPKDIESAVQAGQYTQAEAMLREVLQDKPQSAKAHYELGQVLAHLQRHKEAESELLRAKEIDPTLKFAASPEKFNVVLSKVNELNKASSTSVVMEPSVTSGTQASAKTVQEPAPSGTSPLTLVWIAVAALLALGLWLRRSAANNNNTVADSPMPMPMPTPMPAPMAAAMGTPVAAPLAARGFGAQFTPNAQPGYAGAPQGYAAQPTNTGSSTMTGAVVGGLAGVAAGYALSKALEGNHHASASAAGASAASNNTGYVPFDTPGQADLGSFDAGSGSDWDSADGGGGSDDW